MPKSRIASIVRDFEQGKISRRELGKRFAVLGAGATVTSMAVATGSATLFARNAVALQANEEGYLTCNNEQQATYIQNFNPLGPAGGSIRWMAQFGIHENLFVFNTLKNEATPWLATSWGFNEDSTVLTVKLREGVKWNDGEDFNAAGGTTLRYIPALNDKPEHIEALAALCRNHLQGWERDAGDDVDARLRRVAQLRPSLDCPEKR